MQCKRAVLAGQRWMRTLLLASSASAATVNVSPSQAQAQGPISVVDLHVDLAFQVNYRRQTAATASGQLVASRLLEAGVVGLVLPLYIPHEVSPTGPRMADLESSYANVLRLVTGTPPYTVPGQPHQLGQVETWFAFEGAAPFSGRLQDVRKWVNRGVKSGAWYMSTTTL